ncbi:hypothetical protein CRENBAI_006775 [Crenichthys baileyi]|uniref:Uncharacterized protein n=1 Tax=Crenichthys baileyi TaxID=28760 RepID=A0AAV9QQ96_9TELE
MAKFLVELLGCTLPDKGTSPLFECRSLRHLGLGLSSRQQPTFCGTLTNERLLFDSRLKQIKASFSGPSPRLPCVHKVGFSCIAFFRALSSRRQQVHGRCSMDSQELNSLL